MNVVLIGAGRLATCLGKALKENGHTILQVYSRTESSAQKLAEVLECDYTNQCEDIIIRAALYVVAVKDDVLPELLPQVVRGREDALFVHTAGSVPLSVFEQSGAQRGGVFYPMQTFSLERDLSFAQIPIFIEANQPEDVEVLKSLGSSLSQKVYVLPSEGRKRLHLAAVFACNFVNHCYARAEQILAEENLPFDVMLSLVDETAAKVHELSPRKAQTGPAVRQDQSVMNKHLELLQEHEEMVREYRLLSEGIGKLAGQS